MNRNKQIMLILYFIVIIFLFIQLYDLYSVKSEYFEATIVPGIPNKNIKNILISPNQNKVVKYYGTYTSSDNNVKKRRKIYETYSLESNKWNESDIFEYNNLKPIIIADITYDKDQYMILIGLYYDKSDKKYKYNTYITHDPIYKLNPNNKGRFKLIAEDNNIKSICYDNRSGELLGLSSYNGQIYIHEPTTTGDPTISTTTGDPTASTTTGDPTASTTTTQPYPEEYKSSTLDKKHWKGPINQDIPLKKIMYSKEHNLIGIGLFDSFIYKKAGTNWKYEKWDRQKINRTKVNDLLYNFDGCLIATSADNKGILKQTNPELSSEFENIVSYSKFEKRKYILSLFDVLKAKIGYEFEDILFDGDSDEAKTLMEIYNTKKQIMNLCEISKYRKNKENRENGSEDPIDDIGYKHKEIRELYNEIEEINNKMTK